MAEPDKNEPVDPKPNWIHNLAQRSTGLPRKEAIAPPKNAEAGAASLWNLAGIGLQFAGSVIVFLLIGRWIDNYFGWQFGATLTMLAFALIGNFYLLIKQTRGINK